VLNVHIPMSTALELDQRSGYLDGVGPIPAVHARLLLPTAGLRRLFVDADTGVPLAVDPDLQPALDDTADTATDAATAEAVRTRLLAMLGPTAVEDRAEPQHDPSRALTRLIELRDQRCTGIGCSQPARRCDKDHDTPHPTGPTAAWNLSSKSPRCHRAKHHGWTTQRHPDGSTTWTSPLGHTYQRPGVWQAPPPLPRDVTLPPPRLEHLDDHDPHPHDLPLWHQGDGA
jgi:hypothetical protein